MLGVILSTRSLKIEISQNEKLTSVGYVLTLEEISTQNRPPKENNKIIFINFGGRKEKNYFFVCIFGISPHFFTQISIGIARRMRN